MLRLLAFFVVRSSGLLCGSDFKLCLFIFSTGNGKAPCFSKETLQIMWKSVNRNVNLILFVHLLLYLHTKLSTITNNLTHILQQFRKSCYWGLFNQSAHLTQSVTSDVFSLNKSSGGLAPQNHVE